MNKFKNNLLKELQFKKVKILFDGFYLDPEISFEKQKLFFKEDILQLEINCCLIDVGWDSELDPNGFFKIVVIKNYDWDNPLFEKECKTIEEMKYVLFEAIDFTNEIKS